MEVIAGVYHRLGGSSPLAAQRVSRDGESHAAPADTGSRATDRERKTLAETGKKLGKHALAEIATIAKPGTILAWHRKLVAQKFDGSQQRKALGRPQVNQELEALVVRMAQENRSWGYDRIAGALHHLGYTISDQTVGHILKRHGIPPAPERKKTTTWKECMRTHMDVLVAPDFFTTEVWTMAEQAYVEHREGVYWVKGTRVTLDSIVYAFLDGHTAESIQQSFPVLTLEQVYGAITYYLAHSETIEAYLRAQEVAFEVLKETLRRKNPQMAHRIAAIK